MRKHRSAADCLVPLVALAAALACGACSSTPSPPINPQDTIHSNSPDEMPPHGTSGLGTPGGHEDAGVPPLQLDGAVPRGNGQAP